MTRPLLFCWGWYLRRWQGVGLGVFCLLAGSRWLVENASPSTLPPLLGQAVGFAVMSVVALCVWVRGERVVPAGWWRIALAGLLLFGMPSILRESLGGEGELALFTLVPLVVVLGVAALEPEDGIRRLMMPALAGAGGGLLVLPFALPMSLAELGGVALVLLAVVLVAGGGIWLHGLLREVELATAAVVVCGANAVLLGVAGLARHESFTMRAVRAGDLLEVLLLDLPEVFLLLWLVRAMRPEQLAARALWVPVVTVLEGLVLLRPGVDLRLGAGLALMAGGGYALLRWKDEEASVRLGLRG